MTDRTREQRVYVLSIVLSATAVLVLIGAVVWVWVLRPTTWAPLGPFPEQTITTDDTYDWPSAGVENTQEIPAVPIEGPVPVRGTKCYDEAVTVTGVVQWNSQDPRGRTWKTGEGTAGRDPGCITADFENEVPAEVAAWVMTRGRPTVFTISGCETPTRDGGEGETLCWTTGPFALVP